MSAVAGDSSLARYRILRPLGRGGLGEVYLARDGSLGRDVAIKFLTPDKLRDAGARRRLVREARAAAILDHPGICTVYEAGESDDGRGYIVMQYVEGESLAATLERGALPPDEALLLCARIAEALAAAHRKGVIHRDLKPGNVIVAQDGRPVLVDFGIAKVLEPEDTGGDSTETATTQGLIGTPAYMSPEQIQQRPLDGRSDLFSLGLILFECLTGRRAFEGSTTLDTIAAILHVPPPAPSSVRPGLTPVHDELCRRLLAKAPADRFQSADEVVGAIRVLLPDSSGFRTATPPAGKKRGRSGLIAAGVAVLLAATIGGAWMWSRRPALPDVPPDALEGSRRGTEAIREGAYHTGRKDLEQAVAIFPQHALAYARLAEANMELDDPRRAKDPLLRVSSLVPDESRLPEVERLRLHAVRALVLRDVDAAVAAYQQLVRVQPQDAGSWLDLGRAQEAAGLQQAASASYQAAIARDRQYAAAYLRLGAVAGFETRSEDAMKAFAEAERLYRAQSDIEGETQVLLARGRALNAAGHLKAARADLERALRLATDSRILYQQIQAELELSSITASEGRYDDSERGATAAVAEALANGLDTTAAGGLVDLAATLIQQARPDEAERRAKEALRLADDRGARLTSARARVQLASVYDEADRSSDALATLDTVLPFLKTNRYRRLELTALSITARAHKQLDDFVLAKQISADVLKMAETLKDDGQIALAANELASVTTALGDFPAALRLRERVETIHRRFGDQASLPYDLTNRADVLIRLGRGADAERALAEVDAGMAAGLDSYKERGQRAAFLRGMAAATELRCTDAGRILDQLVREGTAGGTAGEWAPAIAAYCNARRGRVGNAVGPAAAADANATGEPAYWTAAAFLTRRDPARALRTARHALSSLGPVSNDELKWRLAAVAAIAARDRRDAAAGSFLQSARTSLDALRSHWGSAAQAYERRPDLVDLKARAGLTE
jgi:serine/threonine-protein kinase